MAKKSVKSKKGQLKKEVTIDDLALMVAKGFDKMDEKMDKGFKEMRTDISSLKTDVGEIKLDIKKEFILRHKDICFPIWRKIDILDSFWNNEFKTFEEYKNRTQLLEKREEKLNTLIENLIVSIDELKTLAGKKKKKILYSLLI